VKRTIHEKKKDLKRLLVGLTTPVDPEVFIEMLAIFLEASGPLVQIDTITADSILDIQDDQKKLKDTPMIRGMKAIHDALASRDIQNKQAYMARVATFPQILCDREKFAEFMVKPDPVTGHQPVSEILVRAAALSRFRIGMKGLGYDLKHVLELAIEQMNEDDRSSMQNTGHCPAEGEHASSVEEGA
jgi:hypothetical protein